LWESHERRIFCHYVIRTIELGYYELSGLTLCYRGATKIKIDNSQLPFKGRNVGGAVVDPSKSLEILSFD
jgi:hypothetical protein